MNLSASWLRCATGCPAAAEAELRLRGDEVFGRRITITYFRDQTDEEAEIDRRYAEATREAKERELERLQQSSEWSATQRLASGGS